MATHSSILAWRIPRDRGAWQATVHGVAKSQTQLSGQVHNPYHRPQPIPYLWPLTPLGQGSGQIPS